MRQAVIGLMIAFGIAAALWATILIRKSINEHRKQAVADKEAEAKTATDAESKRLAVEQEQKRKTEKEKKDEEEYLHDSETIAREISERSNNGRSIAADTKWRDDRRYLCGSYPLMFIPKTATREQIYGIPESLQGLWSVVVGIDLTRDSFYSQASYSLTKGTHRSEDRRLTNYGNIITIEKAFEIKWGVHVVYVVKIGENFWRLLQPCGPGMAYMFDLDWINDRDAAFDPRGLKMWRLVNLYKITK